MTPLSLGILGLAFILAGWVPQTIATLRNGHCDLNLKFVLLYLVGSACLTLYAVQQREPIFIFLNAAATLMSLINLYYSLRPRR